MKVAAIVLACFLLLIPLSMTFGFYNTDFFTTSNNFLAHFERIGSFVSSIFKDYYAGDSSTLTYDNVDYTHVATLIFEYDNIRTYVLVGRKAPNWFEDLTDAVMNYEIIASSSKLKFTLDDSLAFWQTSYYEQLENLILLLDDEKVWVHSNCSLSQQFPDAFLNSCSYEIGVYPSLLYFQQS